MTMTLEQQIELMRLTIVSLEKRIAELERGRLPQYSPEMNRDMWYDLVEAARRKNPYYLRTAIP